MDHAGPTGYRCGMVWAGMAGLGAVADSGFHRCRGVKKIIKYNNIYILLYILYFSYNIVNTIKNINYNII
jgi:hypothetical protein